jgi:hypothetical protein
MVMKVAGSRCEVATEWLGKRLVAAEIKDSPRKSEPDSAEFLAAAFLRESDFEMASSVAHFHLPQ